MSSFENIPLPNKLPTLPNLPMTKLVRVVGWIIVAVVFIWLLTTLFKKNDAGYYQVRQDYLTGALSTRWDPGIYFNGFKKVTTYQVETSYTFSDDPREENVIGPAIPVRFNDGGIGRISGDFRFRLPSNEDDMILLHQMFGGHDALMEELYIQAVKQAVYNTSQLMSSEESYTNKSLFPQWTRDQLQAGVYKTEEYTETFVDTLRSTTETRKSVRILYDSAGNEIRNEPVLQHFGINITQATIREPSYDQNILNLISEKRKFEVEITVAEAEADEARQKKLTVIEDGKKQVTEAEYEARRKMEKEVEAAKKDKTVAVTQANKRLAVAEQMFLAEKARADGLIAQAQGEAEKRRKVKSADNALVARTQAFEEIMSYYRDAYTKISWSPRIATSSALSADGLPPAYLSLTKIAGVVQSDLGLDLKF